jgi:alpha-tubulin suppressor-like RCC1 family protein
MQDGAFNPLVAPTPNYQLGLWSWGSNNVGQLGLNNRTNYSSPKQVGSLTNWSSISGGRTFSAATKTDGTLWTWGANYYGMLGLGNTTYYSSPKQVGSLTNWSIISAGGSFFTAIKNDGSLWSWGSGSFGQLGLGNTTYYSSPIQVGSLTNWLKISSGYLHNVAIKTDGTLWSWGRNNYGQLGLGSGTSSAYSSPKQVGSLTNWLSISCGSYHTLATKTDGTLWSWGYNLDGELGLNTTSNFSSPVQVGALTNWKNISTGGFFSMAIKTDNTLWAIGGRNDHGQLGLGNNTNYSSPKQVGNLTTWNIISCANGNNFTLATQLNGTLWSWGNNTSGQLGVNNTNYYYAPKKVGNLTTWYKISAGYNQTLALQY